jgi:hypothetical protein
LLARSYAVIFLVMYYFLLIRPAQMSVGRQALGVLSAVVFTLVYIGAEEVARALADGRLITGLLIPEFVFVVISFLAFVWIILAQRK